MPAPLAPGLRAAILADIGTGLSRGQIARKHGVSPGTVTNIARKEGRLESAFDRTHALKGARARSADNKAKRSQLQSDLLDDAQRLRERAWSRYPIVVGSMEGPETVWLEKPPLLDVRAAYASIGICVDKDAMIERTSASGDGESAQRSLLGQLFQGLAAAVSEDGAIPEASQE